MLYIRRKGQLGVNLTFGIGGYSRVSDQIIGRGYALQFQRCLLDFVGVLGPIHL
jgi:hypothetical protein